MQLSNLIENFSHEIDITGLTLDSRSVQPNYLFLACVGTHLDGRKYIDSAIQRGAVAVFSEGDSSDIEWRGKVPIISVKNLSKKTGEIAARFYGFPSKKMQIVGITGTNGKTSCSHFVAAALTQLSKPCGVIGTLGAGVYGNISEFGLTTPDPVTLQKIFAEFLKQNVKHVAMEVSSHSLDQGRVNATEFAVGVFTNLTRDHLDYHGTMENYGNAKKKLFENFSLQHAVINADDEFGRKIITDLHANKNIISYSIEKNNLPVKQVYLENLRLSASGMQGKIFSPWGEGDFSSSLIGKFNASNLLAAFTTLCALGISVDDTLKVLATLESVAGRMQTFTAQQKPLVVVDYSHTPDALEKVLLALRQHCAGKLYCVFGCGGDRDNGKRPIMAKIAETLADVVMVTDDNPRHENREKIVADILRGFSNPSSIQVEHDRKKAIQKVIGAAVAGDCVLIAGKGAETYQIIGDEKIPFSDAAVVQECL